MNRLVMYSQPGCAPCRAAERMLTSKGIAFTKLDITEDPEAHALLTRNGFQQTPIFGYAGELHTMAGLPEITRRIKENS